MNFTQATLRAKDIFVNVLVDADGCTSLDVSLIDSLAGDFAQARVCGQINVTNAPAYALMNLYKLAPGYAGEAQSSMSYFVSVTTSVNTTECAGECANTVRDQS